MLTPKKIDLTYEQVKSLKQCITEVISYYQAHQIHLCYSSPKHAGENMTDNLEKRHDNLPPIHYMCDALSSIVPKAHDVVLMCCLAHASKIIFSH